MKKIAALVLVLTSSVTSCGHSQPPPPQPSVNVADCHLVFCQIGFHANASDCQCVRDH